MVITWLKIHELSTKEQEKPGVYLTYISLKKIKIYVKYFTDITS